MIKFLKAALTIALCIIAGLAVLAFIGSIISAIYLFFNHDSIDDVVPPIMGTILAFVASLVIMGRVLPMTVGLVSTYKKRRQADPMIQQVAPKEWGE